MTTGGRELGSPGEGEKNDGGAQTESKDAPPRPQLEENEVWVIRAFGRSGVDPYWLSSLGTFLL